MIPTLGEQAQLSRHRPDGGELREHGLLRRLRITDSCEESTGAAIFLRRWS